ncbi:MAG: hypothetical protein KGS00_02595 [Alphaproteobacteria bacterium]|nr:hypothetical protein [Alphaproteobacteria bacterium]
MSASVRARLLAISKANGQVFDLVLNRYAVERLLYELCVSAYARRFVLKGATLLMTWLDAPHSGARDRDLLGFGDPDGEYMLAVFREIMATILANGENLASPVQPVVEPEDDGACGFGQGIHTVTVRDFVRFVL